MNDEMKKSLEVSKRLLETKPKSWFEKIADEVVGDCDSETLSVNTYLEENFDIEAMFEESGFVECTE